MNEREAVERARRVAARAAERPWAHPGSWHDTVGERTTVMCKCTACDGRGEWSDRYTLRRCGWCGGEGWVWRGEGFDGEVIGLRIHPVPRRQQAAD